MVYESYLSHYGIKGQKWGLRRYQNEDGTLTEAGKKRYNYGSITVDRNTIDDADTVVLRDAKGKKLEISRRSLRQNEQEVEDTVMQFLASTNGMSVKELKRSLTPDDIKSVNSVIDSCMESKLQPFIDAYGTYDKSKAKSNPSQYGGQSESKDNSKATPKAKPKYTQEEAIDKVYSDLEKKYPDFNKFDQDRQDELFFEHLNNSGMYKYI